MPGMGDAAALDCDGLDSLLTLLEGWQTKNQRLLPYAAANTLRSVVPSVTVVLRQARSAQRDALAKTTTA